MRWCNRRSNAASRSRNAPGGTWVHWVAFNIAPTTCIETCVAALGTPGINSFGLTGYGGPRPPSGTHRYFFTVYSLDVDLALAEGVSKAELLAALGGHVLATAEPVGLVPLRATNACRSIVAIDVVPPTSLAPQRRGDRHDRL